ncbi:MAG: glycoside hydrolase family 127 protein, partial [Anaerolineae bacterium]|nr:glycoside hydrolase family 127 protein [Anaerolineae bacterium]
MILDTKSLPKPVYIDHIQIEGGLWAERQKINRDSTIPAIYKKLQETGRIDSWKLEPSREKPKKGHVVYMFWDSDTAKWIEAVGYSLHTHPDAELQKKADDLINLVESAQQPDGYLNTYFGNLEPENKWRNLRDWHEMYNAGHLIEGAVAYYEATGKRTLLDVLMRYADHIDEHFGPDEGKKPGYPGHPELEMALVKLYRETGEKRYLDLSKFFIDERGKEPNYFDIESAERGENPEDFWAQSYKYCQAHKPIREQTEATGHSVRACYLYAGIADVAIETNDEELLQISRLLWDDLTTHQMYITGGLGPAHSVEGFTFAYDLPNETAYAETCAAISLAFWAHRMFHLDPNGRYIDVMERALYNNILAGVSYEGDHFFYANPLTSYPYINPHEHFSGVNSDKHYRRQDWFFCPCCPPNIARIVASIGGYFYSATADRLYVHLYNQNKATFELSGSTVNLNQETNYPWDGSIHFTVAPETATSFDLALRIPGWCRKFSLEVNGEAQTLAPENGYVVISREWQAGDSVTLTLDMPVDRIAPHPEIRENAGHIALQRGPVVYCLEEADNGAKLANVAIPGDARLETQFEADLFGGIRTITGDAERIEPHSWPDDLYVPQAVVEFERSSFQFKAIPYYLW